MHEETEQLRARIRQLEREIEKLEDALATCRELRKFDQVELEQLRGRR
jgi:cell division protein FtsB